jgi:general secretion pathway protein K
MRADRRQSQRGVALIMVLIALTIMGAMTADLMETNEVYLATTVNARDAIRAEYLARSGVNLSRLLLSFQRLMGKEMNFPFWKYTDLVVEMFTNSGGGGMASDLMGLDLSRVEGLGLNIENSDLKVTVIDEDSKLNVNLANSLGRGSGRKRMVDQLVALIAPLQYDSIFDRDIKPGRLSFKREDVICEILDWSDPDEELCDRSGGEDPSMYQTLEPPYERKNAPFDSLEELHLVYGIDDDFWSTFVEPNPEDPESRVMTVWGKGKVNVNTAPAQVLFPIICMLATDQSGINPCMDPSQIVNLLQILQSVIVYRQLIPFSKAKQFIAVVENPETMFLPLPGFPVVNKRYIRDVLTAQSSVFSIYSEATVGNVKKRIHVVIDMKSEDKLVMDQGESVSMAGGKVLYWRTE